jgi:dipeptidyl aminopeptidase/acylaminoacyl peptidase
METPDVRGDVAAWKRRFRAPFVLWAQLARSAPERGVAVSNRTGIQQLYAWDVPGAGLRQLTDRPEGQVFASISPDGRDIYYLLDTGGSEIGHWVRVPFDGGEPVDTTPSLEPYSSFDLQFSTGTAVAAFSAGTDAGITLYRLDLSSGQVPPHELHRTKTLAVCGGVSSDGAVIVLATTEAGGRPRFNLVALDAQTGETRRELSDGNESSLEPVMFSRVTGDHRFLATSDKSGATRPLIWDIATGERTDLEVGGLQGDVGPHDWSDDGRLVLLCQTHRAAQRLFVYDVVERSIRPIDHERGMLGFWDLAHAQLGPGGEIVATWQDETQPGHVIAIDATTGRRRRALLSAEEVPPGRSYRPVSFPSSDGEEIQAWLAVPEGEGPFPTILETHGGPESVTMTRFDPKAQAWLDHGFAFLSVNYRGSITFGREFKEKIWGRPGHWEVEDMVAARQWLVDQGIAIPDRVLVTGWSYGGYLTLQALGKRPDLWAGGMAGVAFADYIAAYEDENEQLKAYDAALMGGTPEEKREQYIESSPITYAEQVRAPVLVIQGLNDSRCPDRQLRIYEARMRELGKEIEVVWFEAGHLGSMANAELAIEHMELMLAFAKRVLQRRGAAELPATAGMQPAGG